MPIIDITAPNKLKISIIGYFIYLKFIVRGGAGVEFTNEHIIEDLYSSDMVTNMETTPKYKELLKEYNKLFDSIEDEELKVKLEKLEEMKNNLYGKNDKQIFKVGFSMATKMIVSALTCKI